MLRDAKADGEEPPYMVMMREKLEAKKAAKEKKAAEEAAAKAAVAEAAKDLAPDEVAEAPQEEDSATKTRADIFNAALSDAIDAAGGVGIATVEDVMRKIKSKSNSEDTIRRYTKKAGIFMIENNVFYKKEYSI
jgi:hypothetical protein